VLHDFLSAVSLSDEASLLIMLNNNFDASQNCPKPLRVGKVALLLHAAA
jgi:hypothetical protein